MENRLKVEVILKDKQKIPEFNRWMFTHCGERKEVISKTVSYYVKDRTAAMASFEADEVSAVYLNDEVEPLKMGGTNYHDFLVHAVTKTNEAFVYSNAYRTNDKIFGKGEISYQNIIDLCNESIVDLRAAILALEILKENRA